MEFSLHPNAVEAFNKKALELIPLVKECPIRREGERSEFQSEVPVKATLTDKDVIDFEESASNYRGDTTARFFNIDGRRFGLEDGSYHALAGVVSKISENKAIGKYLSERYIEDVLFSWIKAKLSDKECNEQFFEALMQAAKKDVRHFLLWVPIANLEIERNFEIGRVQIRMLRSSVIDEWKEIAKPSSPDDEAKADQLFDDMRNKFQGRAAAYLSIEAEQRRAIEIALDEADRVTAILGIFSFGAKLPDIRCSSKIKGSENIAMTNIICTSDNMFSMQSSISEVSAAKTWRLSERDVKGFMEHGLELISELLRLDATNDFQKSILTALFIYSKSSFTSDPVEKIVYILTSLESILLKNESEPIQQNLAERISMLIASRLEERKDIISVVKTIYGLRSRYLHHGSKRSELEVIEKFMFIANLFHMQALKNIRFFENKIDFITALDDAKLA
jgi:hypothetical protein